MTDREKLIELLAPTNLTFKQAENIADYLLDNGVTIREKGEWKAEHEHTYIGNFCKKWDNFYCSLCDAPCNAPYNFCQTCGADMRRERKTDD